MVVLTAKVDFKKMMLILGAAAVVLLALILFFGGSEQTFGSQDVSGNDGRVAFLKSFGWEVVSSPKESGSQHAAHTVEIGLRGEQFCLIVPKIAVWLV